MAVSSRNLLVGALSAGLVTATSIGAAAVVTGDSSAYPRATSVEQYLESLPGVALLVPGDLEGRYRWSGPSLYSTSQDGLVTSRTSEFLPTAESTDATVSLCNDQPGTRQCTAHPGDIVRSAAFDRVVIHFTDQSPPAESTKAYWREVPLVPAQSADWIR